jgi:hypothetical protein
MIITQLCTMDHMISRGMDGQLLYPGIDRLTQEEWEMYRHSQQEMSNMLTPCTPVKTHLLIQGHGPYGHHGPTAVNHAMEEFAPK